MCVSIIRGNDLKWLQSYHDEKWQLVEYSSIIPQHRHRVPQGTTCDTSLFLLNKNDLQDYVKNCKVMLFTADTIYFVGDDLRDLVHRANNNLNYLFQHLCQHKLVGSTDNSK